MDWRASRGVQSISTLTFMSPPGRISISGLVLRNRHLHRIPVTAIPFSWAALCAHSESPICAFVRNGRGRLIADRYQIGKGEERDLDQSFALRPGPMRGGKL